MDDLQYVAGLLGFKDPTTATREQVRESIEALLETGRFHMVRTGQFKYKPFSPTEANQRLAELMGSTD